MEINKTYKKILHSCLTSVNAEDLSSNQISIEDNHSPAKGETDQDQELIQCDVSENQCEVRKEHEPIIDASHVRNSNKNEGEIVPSNNNSNDHNVNDRSNEVTLVKMANTSSSK